MKSEAEKSSRIILRSLLLIILLRFVHDFSILLNKELSDDNDERQNEYAEKNEVGCFLAGQHSGGSKQTQ